MVGREGTADKTLEAARRALRTKGGGTGSSGVNLEGKTSHEGGLGLSHNRQRRQSGDRAQCDTCDRGDVTHSRRRSHQKLWGRNAKMIVSELRR